MKNSKKLYIFYFVFLALGLIGFIVSAIFFNNLFTEFVYQIIIAGTLFFMAGYLLNSITYYPESKKYKMYRSIASVCFPLSVIELVFKTFDVSPLPPVITGIISVIAGIGFMITYFYSLEEEAKIKNFSEIPFTSEKVVEKKKNYIPILLVFLVIVLATTFMVINPKNIFTPQVQFIFGTAGIVIAMIGAIIFVVESAIDIYKAGNKKVD